MGYDVHITRQNNWWERDAAREISEAEWRAVVEADKELRFCGAAEVQSPLGEVIRVENPLLVQWLGHPQHEIVWLDFRRGNVVVNRPDGLVLEKMKSLALRIGARVQGDESEFYEEGEC